MSAWHARLEYRAWRYVTKRGETREWCQQDLVRAHDWRRVSVVAACSEIHGPLRAAIFDCAPASMVCVVPTMANRLTTKLDKVTCQACRVVLDREMEAGRLEVDLKTLRFCRPYGDRAFWLAQVPWLTVPRSEPTAPRPRRRPPRRPQRQR